VIYATPLLFGFFNRCRGGFLGTNSTLLARGLYWLLPIAILMTFADWRLGWLCAALSYIPLVRPFSHVPFQNDASLKSCLGMAAHAAGSIFVATAPLVWVHPWVAVTPLIGLLAGPAHYIGMKMDGIDSGISTQGFTVPLINLRINPGKFAVGGSEWSEVFRGVVVGVGFIVAFAIHAEVKP